MPVRPEGVYPDGKGGWYFKATVGRDPLTGKRAQITKRGFRTAAAAGRARKELLAAGDRPARRPGGDGMTVNGLLDLYLDGIDADARLSVKTRFDYRKNAEVYVRPLLGPRRLRDVTPETVLEWQRRLAKGGGVKGGKPLAPNTIRLARAPLAGAFKLALASGLMSSNPLVATPRPRRARSVPRSWTPEEARAFLGFMEGDHTYPIWARWRSEILAHHDTGASNGPTEGLNLCVKKVKRCGHGFRTFKHYRLRVLLHAGGVTWPSRPRPPRIRTAAPHSDA